MSSKIEWTGETWNPLRGCSRVSAGCDHCYAEGIAARFSGPGRAFEGVAKMVHGKPHWTGKIALLPDKLSEPLRRRKPTTYFVNSMSDLYHEGVPFEFIDQVFAVMALSPQHTFQILTKRPERMAEYCSAESTGGMDGGEPLKMYDAHLRVARAARALINRMARKMPTGLPWPLPNVWLGVSVEDQATADERIPHLLRTPAAVRFVSYEPALGPVDFTNLDPTGTQSEMEAHGWSALWKDNPIGRAWLDWIICGGESGPGARPMHPDWPRSVRDQCDEAGVPFFFKQHGAWAPLEAFGWNRDNTDREIARMTASQVGRWHAETDTYLVGKKRAGRKLDGEEHNGMPEPEVPF